jgi:segregation and condensation protein B
MNPVQQTIEALIFTSEQSLAEEDILTCITASSGLSLTKEELQPHLQALIEKYSSPGYSFGLVKIAGGYQFLTKKEYQPAVSLLLQQKARKRLSTAAMETLAIVAYKQPITKAEIEHIRGVSSDYSIQKLLEKDLIEISGKSEGPGKPVLYATSRTFMDYFGINSTKDLPQLKDVYVQQNEIGQQIS